MAQTQRVTRGWVVGRVLGARVIVQWSSLVTMVVFALIWGQASGGGYSHKSLATGLEYTVIVFGSVFLHEFAHALAGRAFGREIKEIVLTLMGAHTSFDGRNLSAAASGVIAAAGPGMNAILGLGAYAIANAGVSGGVREVLDLIAYANVLLALFNFLPGIPMDGGKVLEAIVWGISGRQRLGTVVAAWGGRVVAIGVLVYVASLNFRPGYQVDLFSVMWGALIFSFLWPASTAALRGAGVQERVDAVTVLALMRPAIGIRYDATVAAAVREATQANAEQVVVLSTDGHAAGHFSVASALEVPEDRRDSTGLAAVTIPSPRGAEVGSDLTGRAVLEHVREWWGKTDAVAVMDDGEVVGVVLLAEVGERLK
jgi:Zn-dependent protease